jgi:hypothetical protein
MKVGLVVALLAAATVASAIDTKVCDHNHGHRKKMCVRLVTRVNKLADVPGPTCPVPPTCPQANLAQRAFRDAQGQLYTELVGVLADPAFPACIGKFFLTNATYYGPAEESVGGDGCTGTLTIGRAPQLPLGADTPFIGSVTGTLQCDCCGALDVNAQFVP